MGLYREAALNGLPHIFMGLLKGSPIHDTDVVG